MAVNAVQQLINRRDAVEKEVKDKDERLTSLRETHHMFWATLRNQCSETLHDQTPEQVERRTKRSAMYQELHKISFQERLTYSSPLTMDDLRMMRGYSCPYCRGRVGGYPNETDSRFNINSRSDFAKWLAQDTTNWPQERICIYEDAKKEVEEYFAQVEPLEQCIDSLIQERQDIDKQLDAIWNMCDKVLGKSREYESIIAKLNKELYPHDGDDAYYTD